VTILPSNSYLVMTTPAIANCSKLVVGGRKAYDLVAPVAKLIKYNKKTKRSFSQFLIYNFVFLVSLSKFHLYK